MPRSDDRRDAVRFFVLALGWLATIFAWACVLSFDIADAPSNSVWPPPASPHNICGSAGAHLAFYAFHYVGHAIFVLLGLITLSLIAGARGATFGDPWLRLVGFLLIATASAGAAAISLQNTGQYLITGPGGVLGTAVAGVLLPGLGQLGTAIVLAMTLIVGLILAADTVLIGLFRGFRWVGERSGPALARSRAALATAGNAVANGVVGLAERTARPVPAGVVERKARSAPVADDDDELLEKDEKSAHEAEDEPDVDDEADDAGEADDPDDIDGDEDDAAPEPDAPAPAAPPTIKPQAALVVHDRVPPPASRPPATPPPRINPADDKYKLPSLELLGRPVPVDRGSIEALCREKAFVLEQTLNEFRLEVQVVAIETGPVITVFELKLAPGIKVSQIAALTNDMARALKAPAVRVVAPLPGKNTIGIEVPNIDKEKVRLRDIMETYGGRVNQNAIPLFLGKDAAGQPLVADLTRMPHLLIAGTTGSGKSVCINSIIMSFLLTRTPSEVSLILVDPKVVELAVYRDVPHLMCPIVTDTARAAAILEWAATKMDERYALFAEAGVRDIRSYNRLGQAKLLERLQATEDELDRIPVYLPYIVVVIDELADLMMTSAKEVEFYLCRIAQKSRAVGIHLIVSTQRPQANVVTGLIKSNMPCRIAFRVASRLDSRIVLDQNGGEVLMGQGDMLFLPPGSAKLVRAQGTFIDDEELRVVVGHAKEQRGPQFHPELVRMPSAGGDGSTERDELFDQAVDLVVESGRGSVSLLQRRLTVGYGRASRLIDQMYEAGLVGEYKGSQAREVLVTRDEWEKLKSQRNREEAAEATESADG